MRNFHVENNFFVCEHEKILYEHVFMALKIKRLQVAKNGDSDLD